MDFNLTEENKILQWLEKNIGFENYQNAIDRGLDRIGPLFSRFIQRINAKVVTIAGTNGKGEVAYYCSAYLKKMNKSYTMWTSPHIISVRERFQSHEGKISYRELWSLFENVETIQKKEKITLSFYEFLFLCFVIWSHEKKVDYLVLEVGLGGRLDATNLFDANVSAITSIGRDHQNFLGNRLDKILLEKLGIARKGRLTFSSLESSYLRNKAKRWGFSHGVFIHDLFDSNMIKAPDSFSKRNKILARVLIKELVGSEPIDNVYIDRFPNYALGELAIDFNGAHNPAAIRSLMKSLCTSDLKYDWTMIAFSKRSPKDIETMLATLLAYTGKIGKIYLTTFDNWKAISSDELSSVSKSGFEVILDWKSFLNSEKSKKANVLISGSNYFLGNVYHYLLSSSKSTSTK